MTNKIISLFLTLLFISPIISSAQTNNTPRWVRHPAISPNGQWIVFEYRGDLFKVATTGGEATALTITPDYESYPVWSPDGKSIAFASDRYGNFDIYVMNADGGASKRLTYNSASDIPYYFSPDGSQVVFGTARNSIYTSVRFPSTRYFKMLYTVPVSGGRSLMVNAAGMDNAKINTDGSKIIFQDRKGYESNERKHERAAITRDIWTYDVASGKYRKLTNFNGNDLSPVWGNGDTYYYLSEKVDDNLNVYAATLSTNHNPKELTRFAKNPVRNLSHSDNGILCFTQGGDIYTLIPGQQPKKVNISQSADFAVQTEKTLTVSNKQISEMAVSPDGSEVAFVYRGDIFVTSTKGKMTQRLTSTPYQERMIDFSPDGRSIVYSVEKDSSWDIHELSLGDKNELYFFNATEIKDKPLIATSKDEFQPLYSPKGNKIAYLENRNILKVYNKKTGKTTTVVPEGVNYSYADGDQYYSWSPDGKWLLVQSQEGSFTRSEIDLVRADGSGERKNLTRSGFGNQHPKWGWNGKAMLWITDREGMRNPSRGSQGDVYAMFFNRKAYDRFNLSKQDYKLLKEKEKKEEQEQEKEGKKKKKKKSKKKSKKIKLNTDNLVNRTQRLTINSSKLSDFVLSKDHKKLYYLAKYENKYQVWEVALRTHDTKVLAHLNTKHGGTLSIDTSGKTIFVLAGGKISRINVSNGKVKKLSIHGKFRLNPAGERAYIFEHTWRQVVKKIYKPSLLPKIDWIYYRNFYSQFLPYINNNYDFRDLLSEMLGELDVSHTGARYYPHFSNPDKTASLGMLYNSKKGGKGLQIKVIIQGGPMDNSKTKVQPGDYLQQINGVQITDDFDWAKLLNHKTGRSTRLTFSKKQSGQNTWAEVIQPISKRKEQNLLYHRWVKIMAKKADSLSNGQVGYVHVRGMNDASFRTVINRVLGKNFSKKALIVDTRFNGGGWLHDDLLTFLNGTLYLKFAPQGKVVKGGESSKKWDKPSCVLMSEGNYSDAFLFPFIYKLRHVGKLIGMSVAGTGTAVWWERQIDPTIIFGIPMVGTKAVDANHFTENHELEPDIKVPNPYNKVLNGQDMQLKAAVKEMLKETK